MIIKICGIQNQDTLICCENNSINFFGMIFYPKSPRNISIEKANQITEVILKYEIKAIIVSNTTEGNRDKLKSANKYQKGGLSGKPLEEKSNDLLCSIA